MRSPRKHKKDHMGTALFPGDYLLKNFQVGEELLQGIFAVSTYSKISIGEPRGRLWCLHREKASLSAW